MFCNTHLYFHQRKRSYKQSPRLSIGGTLIFISTHIKTLLLSDLFLDKIIHALNIEAK